jgi:DNA-binding CsgD family transcriptional regulator
MNQTKKKKFWSPARIATFCGTFALATATIMNIVCGVDFSSILPHEQIVIPVVNGICTVLCFLLFLSPSNLSLQLAILIPESIFTTLSGYDVLGNFLYMAIILYLFCSGFFRTKSKQKIVLLFSIWFLVLLTLENFGWNRVIFADVIFIFMFSFFLCLYDMLRDQLCFLLPTSEINRSEDSVVLPPAGSALRLSNYGLTERQINLVLDTLESTVTYTELGEKYYTSPSAIKKNMSKVYKIFGVKNKEMLKILLLQYKVYK